MLSEQVYHLYISTILFLPPLLANAPFLSLLTGVSKGIKLERVQQGKKKQQMVMRSIVDWPLEIGLQAWMAGYSMVRM